MTEVTIIAGLGTPTRNHALDRLSNGHLTVDRKGNRDAGVEPELYSAVLNHGIPSMDEFDDWLTSK